MTSRTVLITGASRGIGQVTAQLFHDRGWNVAATMRSPNRCDLTADGRRMRTYRLDVSDTQSVTAAVADILADFGTIDVLVNNAASCMLAPFETLSEEEVAQQFDINVHGAMRMTRAVLPHMRERRTGRIINVSSICGRMTLPLYSTYCATKWALEGFSEALNYELRQHGIKIKLVEPAVFKTGSFEHQLTAFAERPDHPAYDDFSNRVLKRMKPAEARAPGPEGVAKVIWKAANDRFPRLRYPVRSHAILGARSLLPGMLYTRAVRRILNAW